MEDAHAEFTRHIHSERLLPQEETLEVAKSRNKISIGIPKESEYEENRVSLIPNGVNLLVRQGHHIFIEAGAGLAAHFTDHDYSEAGAEIVSTPQEVFKADLILKVAPVNPEEIEFMKPKQTLISALHLPLQNEEYFRKLMSKKITALASELIRDKANTLPVIRSMSEIAGSASVFIAAEYLANPEYGSGKMFGGITGIGPTEVVIIGAGTVGEFATRSALGLGALVKIFDNSVSRLRRLQNNLGIRIFSSILDPQILKEAMQTADVLIGAIHSPNGKSPCLITEEMLREMKEGAVIIDVSIDQGGCFETSRPTTHSNPVFKLNGITHYCVPNIASKVPRTASQALNNIFVPVILEMGNEGGIEFLLKKDYSVRQGVYLYNGTITHLPASKMFNLPFQDIDLLMAAFR